MYMFCSFGKNFFPAPGECARTCPQAAGDLASPITQTPRLAVRRGSNEVLRGDRMPAGQEQARDLEVNGR